MAVEHVNAARAGRARFNDEEVEWLGRIKTEELWNTGGYTDWLDFFDKTWGIKKPTAWKYIYQDEFIKAGSSALWDRPDALRLYATGEDTRELGSIQRPAR